MDGWVVVRRLFYYKYCIVYEYDWLFVWIGIWRAEDDDAAIAVYLYLWNVFCYGMLGGVMSTSVFTISKLKYIYCICIHNICSWVGVGIYSETRNFLQFEKHYDRRMRCTHTALSHRLLSFAFSILHSGKREPKRGYRIKQNQFQE